MGAILLAVSLSPTFTWAGNALSDLGTAGAANPWLFNGGLIAGALIGLPFAVTVWRVAGNGLERLASTLYALSVVLMGLVGVFPSPHPLHFPVALGFFLLLTATLTTAGIGAILDGVRPRGVGFVTAGLVHLATWYAWIEGIRVGPGLAIPEFVGSILFFGWIVWLTWYRISVIPNGHQ